MLNFILSLSLVSMIMVSVGCNAAELAKTKICGLPGYNLQNRYLKLAIIPQSNGRISALSYQPDKLSLLQPYTETHEMVSPLLPKVVMSNRNGYKLWFWGKASMANCDLKVVKTVVDKSGVALALAGRYYMAQKLMITRDISLPTAAAVINIKTTLFNVSDSSKNITLWVNAVPAEVGQTIYPIKAGLKRVQGRIVQPAKQDMLLRQRRPRRQTGRNFFAAPAQPWIARVFPQQKLIMAYVTDWKNIVPGGLFYTWHGFKEGKEISSLEMVFAPRKIDVNQVAKFNTRIMVFKGLENLKTICGDVGIDCAINVIGDNIKINMFLNSVTPQKKLKLSVGVVSIKQRQAKLIGEQSLIIDKLVPAITHSIKITIPVKELTGDYYLAGEINGKKFLVLEAITLNEG